MKKLLAMMLMIAMLLCGMTVFAEEETLDMVHDTALAFLDSDIRYDYELTKIEIAESGNFNLLYSTADGDLMAIALNPNSAVGYYEAETVGYDLLSIAMFVDGYIYSTTCADYGYTGGNPCTVAITAFNDNGWYQIVAMGTLTSEDTNETHEIVMAFDFLYGGNGPAEDAAVTVPDIEIPVLDQTGEHDEEEDEEYFIADTAEIKIGEDVYVMTLSTVEEDDGIFAMYEIVGTGYVFAVGIVDDAVPGEYYCGEVSREMFYCAFIDEDGAMYMGGCSNNVEDDYGKCDIIVNAAGENGLYQIGVMGELVDSSTGNAVEIAGFVDFTFK